ncbi:MAG: NADH dehydrogenase [Spirochaetes bacterium GWD1_61_31]|nr:MAG: NADH dehydrogenase [Spirochaetes bacterium GWB1_60_80]OHD35338.1 MAG: NADH dehydrogenase [Spirochaetes bacterium GWC1_61_12]OHD43664.1 MAG: NADH dehydrogenase [Spirochaetes bacterium GWD1_61_31]OHD44994.1 MAG: NADH dehydrogenase [Spirochaetes bacterium GWE1_60_18]OHD60103.1 MAG: NADH dehydrogenase [Spirochaetes bacterium GWF1_60_12]HAP43673.1 NAD(P)H-dependent oxidoreductase subunit E [Spirochaetaceae bacterium]
MAVAQIEFSKELESFVREWKDKPGNLIMILHRVQQEFTFIPREAAERLARDLEMPLARIYGVITFYHYFKTTKPGKHRIAICMGTACYLKGGQELVDETQRILGIKGAEVTANGLFSIDAVRCVGCCGLAPVLMVGDDVYGKLTTDQVAGIVAKYQAIG